MFFRFFRFLGFNVGRSETKLRLRSTWRTSHTRLLRYLKVTRFS